MFNLVLNTSLYSIVRDLYLNNLRLKSEIKYKHIYNHQYEVSKAFPSKVSKYGAFSGPYFPVFLYLSSIMTKYRWITLKILWCSQRKFFKVRLATFHYHMFKS